MHSSKCIHTHTHVSAYRNTQIHIWAQTHNNTHMYTDTHTHTLIKFYSYVYMYVCMHVLNTLSCTPIKNPKQRER